jgi:ribosomal protein S18 acetylase RimI-like enzyme
MSASSQAIQVSIRRINADDWQQVRCVRLAALADAPSAFENTLADEVAFPDERWQERAANNAEGLKSCGFLAFIADVPCGFVVGVLSEPDQAELHALWVAQNVRRHGTGVALVQSVCAWARERGAARLSLRVVAANGGAVKFYEALGFEVEQTAAISCGARQDPALRMHKRL